MMTVQHSEAVSQEATEQAYISDFKQKTTGSKQLFDKAQRVTPGGISHFPRYHTPYPTFCAKARGSRMWDVDGNEYIDLWMSHYDAILGHSPTQVVDALKEILSDGLHVGIPMEYEVRLAGMICDAVPCAEQVRFCCSGTEADMYAVRLARGFTNRNVVLKMRGGFHGANTDLSTDVFPPNFNGAEGIGLPPDLDRHTRSVPFNDIEGTRKVIREVGGDLAAVITEPVLGAFMLPAKREYLEFLREETVKAGALLILDEVITGFRVTFGGAQDYYGVTPDLTTLGKVMGGGMPIGAISGRADVLEISSVQRQVPQAEKLFIGGGTYSCNPLSMVAGSTTLEILKARKDEIYPTLEARNIRLCEGLQNAFDSVDIPVLVSRAASLMDIHFLKEKGLTINNPDDLVDNTIMAKKEEFCGRLRNHGVYLIHSSALSIEHSDEDIDKTISIAAKCAEEMAENR